MDSRKISIVATVVLGIIVMGVGCHAYFESLWNQTMRDSEVFREYCKAAAKIVDKTCPSLAMEMYFVSITIIAAILSIGLLLSHFLINNDSIKRMGTYYNIAAGALIFIGAITLIVSATQVKSLYSDRSRNDVQYYDEKIAAGALSIINALIYVGAGVMGLRSPS